MSKKEKKVVYFSLQTVNRYFPVWKPADYMDLNSWYLVDLLVVHDIFGAHVKGDEGSSMCTQWSFSYSNDSNVWIPVNNTDNTNEMVSNILFHFIYGL